MSRHSPQWVESERLEELHKKPAGEGGDLPAGNYQRYAADEPS
jgi:hypothetical protein